MSAKIGHASIDENGEIAGGKVGDQTGREICTRDWYKHKYGWNVVLKCTDKTLIKKAVKIMEQICADPDYGYDQDQRLTAYNAIKANKWVIEGAKGEADCSSLICLVLILAGLTELSPAHTTRSLKKALLATGKFVEYADATHTGSDKYAQEGDIYLSEGHHVVMIVDDGQPDKGIEKPTELIHTVGKGDNLTKIAAKYKVTVDYLAKLNNIKNPDIIKLGQKIKIK